MTSKMKIIILIGLCILIMGCQSLESKDCKYLETYTCYKADSWGSYRTSCTNEYDYKRYDFNDNSTGIYCSINISYD